MTRRTVGKLVTPHLKLPRLGGNFCIRVEDAVAGVEVATHLIFPRHPALNNSINDNYCKIDPPVTNFLQGQKPSQIDQTVNLNVVFPAPYVIGQSQKKDISPSQVQNEIKCVKDACCVSHCLCAQNVKDVNHVVRNPPVGGRLQMFWQVWLFLSSNPRVVSILKEGYTLPFKVRPPLTRSPLIVSGYANPVKNKHLKESLQALIQKQAVEKVIVPSFLAFYNRLFLVPKLNNKWRPILDLSQLNLYLAPSSFKKLQRPLDSSFNKGSGSLWWISATLTFIFR